MTTYLFTFPVEAAGLDVDVKNEAGDTVDTQTLGSSPDDSGVLELSSSQASGNYVGTISLATAGIANRNPATWQMYSDHIDVTGLAASIAAGGGGSVPAKFIGRGTGDTSGSQFPLTFEVDGDGVNWADVDGDGNIALPGPVVVEKMLYRFAANLNFSEATGFSTADTGPDTDATVLFSRDGGNFDSNAGGPFVQIAADAPGDTFDVDAAEQGLVMSERCAANNELVIKAQINADGFDASGDAVTDGVLTGALSVWIYRADLPPLPALS